MTRQTQFTNICQIVWDAPRTNTTINTYISTKLFPITSFTLTAIAKYDALVRAYFVKFAVDEESMKDPTADHFQSLERRHLIVAVLTLGWLPTIGVTSLRCAGAIYVIQKLDDQRYMI